LMRPRRREVCGIGFCKQVVGALRCEKGLCADHHLLLCKNFR